MKNGTLIGRKIIEIYETIHTYGEDLLGLGQPHYFQIVLELEDKTKFELGLHEIKEWNSEENLIPSKGTSWAIQNNLKYKNQIIKRIIERDSNEYFEGSLTIVLDNNVILEHQCSNGNQLFISTADKIKIE